MKITINGNAIEGTPEELAEYQAMVEDLAKADSCEDVCCQAVEGPKVKLKAGDYVKITRKMIYYDNDKLYEIVNMDDSKEGPLGVIDEDGDYNGEAINDGEYVLATPEEIEQFLKASEPKLKAGDYVVFSELDCHRGITIGKPYEVKADDDGDLSVIGDDGYDRYYVLSDDDVKFEILEGEALKFAKLGRKVGEFKKGDIVRAAEMIFGHTAKYGGVIGKVEDITKDMVGIRYHNGYCCAYTPNGNVELIAPVEAVLS